MKHRKLWVWFGRRIPMCWKGSIGGSAVFSGKGRQAISWTTGKFEPDCWSLDRHMVEK